MADRRQGIARGVVALLTAIACCGVSMAASVERVGTGDLVREAQFIFHGTVLSTRVGLDGETESIVTRVLFRVDEVIKGAAGGDTIELVFAGGTYRGLTLAVSDMTIPAVGEEGIYFVEQLGHRQVNPIYGWSQGYFLVRHDAAGRKVVSTYDLEPTYGLELRSAAASPGLSSGHADGVVTKPPGIGSRAISLQDFKALLRKFVEATR